MNITVTSSDYVILKYKCRHSTLMDLFIIYDSTFVKFCNFREHKLREDLKSQQHETEKKILTIWKLTGRGKKTSPEPNSSKALTELEKFIIETKQSSEK